LSSVFVLPPSAFPLLAEGFLDGLAQRRPLLLQTLVLDLLELLLADLELIGDELVGLPHVADQVLRGHQRMEDFLLLRDGQAFRAHGFSFKNEDRLRVAGWASARLEPGLPTVR